jgi:signal transduction histidine kinase
VNARPQNEAKEWVQQAIAFYKASGKRIAFAAFTDPAGMFVQDEMYIYVLNPRGTMLAHGVNEKFVGEEFIDLKDSDGKPFIREIVDTANSKGSGWVEYRWFNPASKKWTPKIAYFEKVDDLIVCGAVYREEFELHGTSFQNQV